MSDLVVSFEPESGFAPPPTGPAVPRTAPVLLRVLAGLAALAAIMLVWAYFVALRSPIPVGGDAAYLVQSVAVLLFAIVLVLLARGVHRGSARARYAAFGVAGYEILSACFGFIELTDLFTVVGTPLWNLAYVMPIVGSQLGSLPQMIVAGFLFRALAAPALRDHCEPRG